MTPESTMQGGQQTVQSEEWVTKAGKFCPLINAPPGPLSEGDTEVITMVMVSMLLLLEHRLTNGPLELVMNMVDSSIADLPVSFFKQSFRTSQNTSRV